MVYLNRLDVKFETGLMESERIRLLYNRRAGGTRSKRKWRDRIMETEQTLVLIKPDGVRRGLIGEIINRYERKGLKIVGMKLLRLQRSTAEELYAVHYGRPFYEVLIRFMTSAPIVALVVEGREAIALVRILNGATDPKLSQPGSIRGDLSVNITHNVVHASDSPENAQRELEIVFAPEERYGYERVDGHILHPETT